MALIGIMASMVPPVAAIEKDIGLGWLFELRGARPAPAEVVVVTIDRQSSDALGLPNKPSKWPRALHARLVRKLKEFGAQVVIFDVIFEEARNPAQDAEFAQACREAGNIVLFEYLKRESLGGVDSTLMVERVVPPITELARAAAALAPFPLPKVPVKVSDSWLFKTGAGDAPTLPVAALQLYARPFHAELLRLLHETASEEGFAAPALDESPVAIAQDLRQLFLTHPNLAPRLRARLKDQTTVANSRARSVLRALVDVYSGPSSRTLDFYGPPRSITTIPYYRVLEGHLSPADFAGKAVFVGFSEQLQPEQKDGFYTVFSQPSGLDMSGVEIAATAFANLLEGHSVKSLPLSQYYLVIALWGLALGTLLLLPPVVLLPTTAALAAAYFGLAYHSFAGDGTWLPVVVPLLLQLPAALLGALLWRYLDVRRERQRIRKAFQHYLPGPVVDALSRGTADMTTKPEVMHGICLATDAEQYATLAERLQPEVLHTLLNRYYDTLFEPVRRRGGFISDVVGDSMLAIWAARTAQPSLRGQACHAALDIMDAVDAFNRRTPEAILPTRLGLHCGEIVLGNVGAGDHYEYRAVGDIVNTATRVEGLNKQLGTRALASLQMIEGIEDIVTRELGSFRLSGKTQPLVIHELVGRAGQVDAAVQERCAVFAEGLRAFRAESWREAVEAFQRLLTKFGDDEPSRYYLHLCELHANDPPPTPWDGVINLRQK
ncbi:MAG: adenylate/guanylate cyclase domain-containing protein [Thiobacillaceae bacterium]